MQSKNKKVKKQTPFRLFLKSFIRTILVLLIASMAVLIGAGFGMVTGYIKAIPANALDIITSSSDTQTTIVYDQSGNEIARLHGNENRIRVPYSKIPKNLINAFVAIEDERFWQHNGIDIKRIFGAIFKNIKSGSLSEGASTITQQLVRNKLLTFEKSFKRKIQEQYLAIQLEKIWTKEQILEEYLNTINLGSGAYGVGAAAYTYFGKDVSQLTLAECALIAGITQNPSYYNPYVFPDHAKKKQEIVLKKMLELGYITEQEYLEAINQPLVYVKKDISEQSIYKHPYFVDSVIDEAIEILSEKKRISKDEAENLIYGGGLKIYTTMDENIQSTMEDVFSDLSIMPKIKHYDASGIPQPQAAAVLIDFKTGAVKGIMGGRGNLKGVRLLNRATMSVRQPGSAIKPIADYSLALENGYTAATVIDDVPFSVGRYTPRNWYKSNVVSGKRGYKGLMTLREALQWSANIPAVKFAYNLGIQNVYRNLKRFGFTTLSPQDMNSLSIAIGGFTYGVKPIELTAAFAAVANSGVYIKPYFITKIEDKNGIIIFERTPYKRRVMDEKNAYILTNILQSVVTSRITVGVKFSYPVAGKTGTTDDSKDRWFVGYTPNYALGVWVGEDKPVALNYITGTNPALKIFKAIMDRVVSQKGVSSEFLRPAGIVERYVCKESGKLATSLCKQDPRGSQVIKEIFVEGTEPTEYCDKHVKLKVCTQSKKLATQYCPNVIEKIFIKRDNPIWPGESIVPPDDYMYQAPNSYCDIHKAPQEEIVPQKGNTSQLEQPSSQSQQSSSAEQGSQQSIEENLPLESNTTQSSTYSSQ
ncbi:penicillin-binding protein, 1A family [Caldicellulosiruptor kronotskyensis 2002]|uniref:Penicillin-binding protein, 1A family n=1 Tax=Caldicellulosiruptor kronotskyensis (strain DSM 18902 / VKM B-2412 / 2002) TaxID=632348 RepID=E4SHR7_CALK2|nr:PBP1A family penicillin-binding protein [Caldicellulosiruptor kronotskyensis]ADQ47292.1 penicillin-binding protein, 1A family [Caldicellulosiruptor kronotskyensis 2002]